MYSFSYIYFCILSFSASLYTFVSFILQSCSTVMKFCKEDMYSYCTNKRKVILDDSAPIDIETMEVLEPITMLPYLG